MNKEANKSRLGQYYAKYFLTALNISEPLRYTTLHRSVFNDLQKVFLTRYSPRPWDDLLAYGVKGRKATIYRNLHFAIGQDSQSRRETGGQETLGTAYVALRSLDEHRVNSLDLCGTFYQGKVPRQSVNEDKRNLIITTTTGIPLQSGLMSPLKHDLLAYGVKGRKATSCNSLRLAQPRSFYLDSSSTPLQSRLMSPVKILTLVVGGTNVRSECSSDKAWTLGRYQVSRPSGMEDRNNIIIIASAELGIKEATGNNDGPRVEQYLRYTNLGPGYDWCASFVSWVYGQAGFSAPRNPWSPALFPKARAVKGSQVQPADLFAIYSATAKRIHHVGLIRNKQGQYIVTIEGNSNNRVESRRRHVKTVYSYANWVERS